MTATITKLKNGIIQNIKHFINPGCINNEDIFRYVSCLEPRIYREFPRKVYSHYIDIFMYPAK